MKCKTCGRELAAHAKFCSKCGTRVGTSGSSANQVHQPRPTNPQGQPAAQNRASQSGPVNVARSAQEIGQKVQLQNMRKASNNAEHKEGLKYSGNPAGAAVKMGSESSKIGVMILIFVAVALLIATIWFLVFRNTDEKRICGRWAEVESDGGVPEEIEFFDNGTLVTYDVDSDGSSYEEDDGTWTMTDGRLKMDIRIYLSVHQVTADYDISGDTMTWELEDGTTATFEKK